MKSLVTTIVSFILISFSHAEVSIENFKKSVFKVYKAKELDKFYALFAWDNTHFVTRDHIMMFWNNPLEHAELEGDKFEFTSIDWIPKKDFNERQLFMYTKFREINGRIYRPTHEVIGVFQMHYSAVANKEEGVTGLSFPLVVGKDQTGKLFLNTTTIENKGKPTKMKNKVK